MSRLGLLALVLFLVFGAGCELKTEPKTESTPEQSIMPGINMRFAIPAIVRSPNGKEYLVWGYMDGQGREVVPPRFQNVMDFSEERAAVQVDGKPGLLGSVGGWGFIDHHGKMVIEPRYQNVEPFSDDRAAVQDQNGKWGFIDLNGTMVIPAKYADVLPFSEGLAGVSESGSHWALTSVFIDKNGKVATASGFMNFHSFNSGRAIVRNHGGAQERVIDNTGQVLFTAEEKHCGFSDNLVYRDGLLAFKNAEGKYSEGKWGFLDTDGKVAIEPVYDEAWDMSEGFATVRQGTLWGVIDRKGKAILPIKYKPVAKADTEKALKVSDAEMRRIIQDRDFDELFATMSSIFLEPNSLTGGMFVNEAMRPPQFSDGLAYITTPEWSGFVDVHGRQALKAEAHRYYGPFVRGLARVNSVRSLADGRHLFFEYIDRRGRIVFERDITAAFFNE